MKKGLKITLISLLSLLGLFLLTVCFALWSVFSPARLTKLVNQEAPNFLNCNFHIDKADLTLFKTFPHVGIDLHGLLLLNPVYGAPTDTLLYVKHCTASLNIRELLNDKHIAIRDFHLQKGNANLFTNPVGQTNYKIFKATSDTTPEFVYTVDLEKVQADDVNLSYIDLASKMRANLHDIGLLVKGNLHDRNVQGSIDLNTQRMDFVTLDEKPLVAKCDLLALDFTGDLLQLDSLLGTLNLKAGNLTLHSGEDAYLDSVDVALASDINLGLSRQALGLKDAQLALADYKLSLEGEAQRDTATGDIRMDLRYKTETWPLKEALAFIPEALIGNALDGLDLDGRIGLAGTVTGHYNEQEKPLITSDVTLDDGTFTMKDFPFPFDRINSQFHVDLDPDNLTNVTIKELSAYTGRNHITAQGTVKDVLGKMLFELALKGDLKVQDFKELLPESITRFNANAKADLKASFDHDQISAKAFDKMNVKGHVLFTDLDLVYDDSLALKSPSLDLDLDFPVKERPYRIGEWAHLIAKAPHLNGNKLGLGNFTASNAHLDAYVNNLFDSTLTFKMGTTYQFATVEAQTDTVEATLQHPSGTFVMQNSEQLSLKYAGDALVATVKGTLAARTGKLNLTAASHYNTKGKNALLRWNPDVQLQLAQGNVVFDGLDEPVGVPSLNVDFTPARCHIQEGRIKLDESECRVSGEIRNMDKYFDHRGLLSGTLELTSDYLDINHIMDLVNGLGAPDSLLAEKPENSEADPFIVPHGIDIRVNTSIKKALYEDAEIRNVGGHVAIKDGILVLDQMGLTSDAARMQLTALYRTPRKNHLFVGLDFHLLDIKIDKLIAMIPEVDTILPMLKSFAGNAEFHFAVETYLKSNYDLKYSTLRGAAAINGHDLVVLDNETYQNIAKKLRFSKKTENKIDSLSAEITIFKNEIDVYPFAVSIDKYQAILSGRHNLDMTYNYNVSLLKPIRLGLDIIGTDKLKYKLGKAKYADFFKPERQNVVEKNVMQLKQQINQALRANVREQP